MEHILTKDALYLLSYISNLPCGNMMSIAQMHENCKGVCEDFCNFCAKGALPNQERPFSFVTCHSTVSVRVRFSGITVPSVSVQLSSLSSTLPICLEGCLYLSKVKLPCTVEAPGFTPWR